MCQLEIGCPVCEVVGETVSVALQAFLVLDYELSIVMKTAAAVLLGRRREALFSTTRNHSSSQLHKGASQNRGPPTLSRDEDPY